MLHQLIHYFTVPGGPPEEVSAVVLSSTEIQVSWNEIDSIDQNGVIIQYEITYSSRSELNNSVIINGSLYATNITGLEENTKYNISVRAYTSIGPGPFTDVVIKKTVEDG